VLFRCFRGLFAFILPFYKNKRLIIWITFKSVISLYQQNSTKLF
jgi:hypothetical protein